MRNATSVAEQIFEQLDINVGGAGEHDIHVHDERFYDRVIADRELGLGESYQEGWWDANQLDALLTLLISADVSSSFRRTPSLALTAARSYLQNRQTLRRSASNASSHYDIGNDLYERMLDSRMIYSCGYWQDATDLESAQVAKLDLVCRKLGFAPGMRVLDIGCGWGGFAAYAAETYGVHVVGISLAEEQVQRAKQTTRDLDVEIRLEDYRTASGSFDRITSIGMFEHVGPKNYQEFFTHCDRLLTDDGMMLHHTIGRLKSSTQADPWFEKYIFPGGVLPSLAQIARSSEKRWIIEDVHNFGPDYDTTLMAWHANATNAWPDLPHYDERFRRTWDYYLLSSAAGFRARFAQLWQVVFQRATPRAKKYIAVR